MSSSICIIPARGGSKRIPRKNIRFFRGWPILAWSIKAARASGVFTTIMVSTDDAEIASIARSEGAEVPFLRSAATSTDYATTAAVLLEVFDSYRGRGHVFENACCLYPTAPFVTGDDISQGLRTLENSSFDVIVPVTRFSYTIWRSLKLSEGGRIELNFPENLDKRSQDLPFAYHDAGQWYWFRIAPFLETGILLGANSGSIVLSPERVQDIDTEEDWSIAELKHERLFK